MIASPVVAAISPTAPRPAGSALTKTPRQPARRAAPARSDMTDATLVTFGKYSVFPPVSPLARATAAERRDRLDAPRDPRRDFRGHGVGRELDGLLERDVPRRRGREPAGAGEVVRHAQAHGDRGHAGC